MANANNDGHQPLEQQPAPDPLPSTFEAVDTLADQATKEILDKIAASIPEDEEPILRIALCGKTGVGKSSLIEGLLLQEGQAYQKPGRTEKILMSSRKICSPSGREITVEFTDSPGTEALDGVGNKSHRSQYVKEVSEAFRKADIQLLCVRMDDDVREEEVKMIRFFYNKFGDALWVKVVFVLTFANRVTVDCRNEENKEHEYTERFQVMKAALREAMTQAGVRADMVKTTPVCVAGHPEKKQLPNCEDWACPFLVDLLKSGIAENAKIALLNITWRRWVIKNPGKVSTGAVGVSGVVTGLGVMTAGGILSAATVTLPIGIPLIIVGGLISIYCAGATAHQAKNAYRKHVKESEVPKKIKGLHAAA